MAAPFVLLWALSPVIAWRISLPPKLAEAQILSRRETRSLRLIARRTWRFFETFVVEAENFLPPDNFQEDPEPVDRPPHLADEHRPLPAEHDGRPRLRLDRHPRHGEAARGHARDHVRPASLPRSPLQLVRHAGPAAARSRLRLHRRQRQSGGPPDRRGAGVPRAHAAPALRPGDPGGNPRRARAAARVGGGSRASAAVADRDGGAPARGGRGDGGGPRGSPDVAAGLGAPARRSSPSWRRTCWTSLARSRTTPRPRPDPKSSPGRRACRTASRAMRATSMQPCGPRSPAGRRSRTGSPRSPSTQNGWSRRWTSGSSSTPRASCSRSAIARPRARSIPTATTCWPPSRGWAASWPSPRAMSRRGTGSCWAARSRRWGAVPRSSPGRAPCSST